MREIKFRGRKANSRVWDFGNYATSKDGKSFIVSITKDNIGHIAYLAEVDPETVGQYTGLKDKNGVEIYEGDIVKAKYHELRDFGDEIADDYSEFIEEVVWLPTHNGFGLKIMIEEIPLYRHLDFVTKVNGVKLIELEVIGNIYDNPELLEAEE